MKKTLKIFMVEILTGLMLLGTVFNSFAQSDGVISYSDTFTSGESGTAYTEDELEISGTVCVFNDRNFTFRIDKEAIVNKWKNEYGSNIAARDEIWMAELVDGVFLVPITKAPYEGYSEAEIKEVASGVYSLEGLELKENQIYAIMVEITAAPGESFTLSGCVGSFFEFTNVDNGADAVTETETGDDYSASDDDGIDYFWMQNEVGWWVQCSNGTYLVNRWYQSPASGLWYYMGADGYMLTNTTTPDGYTVNADGVWVQ